jgi:hypothetical protein
VEESEAVVLAAEEEAVVDAAVAEVDAVNIYALSCNYILRVHFHAP